MIAVAIKRQERDMSSQPVPSTFEVSTQAFPVLTPAQMSRIRPVGKVRAVKKGEILFEPGDRNAPFYVLLSGSLSILRPEFTGESTVVTYGPGQFAGEMT